MTGDARERFLREIAERLPPERLSELHLFTPLRQGGLESGVAVIAAEPEMEPAATESEAAATDDAAPEGTAEALADGDTGAAGDGDEVVEPPSAASEAAAAGDEDVSITTPAEELPLGELLSGPAGEDTERAAAMPVAQEPRARRHTVYTARYRHTLKGVDRGKWEFDLVAEADAPLVTVDAVVRGVQKRTGDLAEPERLGPDDLRAALDGTLWRATTG